MNGKKVRVISCFSNNNCRRCAYAGTCHIGNKTGIVYYAHDNFIYIQLDSEGEYATLRRHVEELPSRIARMTA